MKGHLSPGLGKTTLDPPKTTQPLARSLAIVVISISVGPLIGGVTVWFAMGVASAFKEGTPGLVVAFLGLGLAVAGFTISPSYYLGFIPALTFGVLFSAAAIWLRWNSVWTSIALALAASAMLLAIPGSKFTVKSAAEAAAFGGFGVLPCVAFGAFCWLVTRSLHRFP